MTRATWKSASAVGWILLLTAVAVVVAAPATEAMHRVFAPGDVFVALRTGEVQWRHPDGTLNAILVGTVPGKVEGMGFDAGGNLYVSHYCLDPTCLTGNSVEAFDPSGMSHGPFGSGYNCNPYSIVFDAAGRAYVGQADCTGDILLFDANGTLQRSFDAAWDRRGAPWVDLAPDGCTLFYTSQGTNVKRYNVCADAQLPDFNLAPLPGGQADALRILPDGGVLVANTTVIVRLDATGALVQLYDVPGEFELWYGLDLVGDGTFWASNYGTSNLYRFDIATGSVLLSFNAGTPTTTVKGVAVVR